MWSLITVHKQTSLFTLGFRFFCKNVCFERHTFTCTHTHTNSTFTKKHASISWIHHIWSECFIRKNRRNQNNYGGIRKMGWVEMILHLAYYCYCGFHGLDFHCFYLRFAKYTKNFPVLTQTCQRNNAYSNLSKIVL